MHTWEAPADISTHGHLIDEQMSETMARSGNLFSCRAAPVGVFHLAVFEPGHGVKAQEFSQAAPRALVIAAVLVVGVEVLALGVFGVKAWAGVYLTPPPGGTPCRIQVQAGQFAFYFPLPRSRWRVWPPSPGADQRGFRRKFFGLDKGNTMLRSRDDNRQPPRWPSR